MREKELEEKEPEKETIVLIKEVLKKYPDANLKTREACEKIGGELDEVLQIIDDDRGKIAQIIFTEFQSDLNLGSEFAQEMIARKISRTLEVG